MIPTYILIYCILFLVIYMTGDFLFQIIFNPILCFFSKSARIRKWDGYTGLFYLDKPLFSTRAAKIIRHMKIHGTDMVDEMKKSRTGDSEYFVAPYVLSPISEIEPEDEELGKGIDLFEMLESLPRYCFNLEYWIYRFFKWIMLKCRIKKRS